MARPTRTKRCPTCGGVDFTRQHRNFWMRWFKGSRLLLCRHCRSRILLLRSGSTEEEEACSEDR